MKLSLLFSFFFILIALSQITTASSWSRKLFRSKPGSNGKLCALLVAGSNGWYNYRHQADVAHAYHVLKSHGVHEDDIIVMMFDDIANSKSNPFPGKLYNNPSGKDVYEGIKIDYKGRSVNPDNFVAVLKGDKTKVNGGNGRVIDCGENDRVFIYFTDHGGVGLIAFPEGILSTKQLNDALNYMHENKRYGELVFYLEACESGSMFEGVLKDDKKIYAITAANGHESSWGTYCENKWHLPCLGDLFSTNWMEDSDKEELTTETLETQFEIVRKETNLSHVIQFGDLSIAKEPVANFQGEPSSQHRRHKWRIGTVRNIDNVEDSEDGDDEDDDSDDVQKVSWPSRDVKLNHLKLQLDRTNSKLKASELAAEIEDIKDERREIKKVFFDLVAELADTKEEAMEIVNKRTAVLRVHCHHKLVHLFNLHCVNFSRYDYALKYTHILNNLCTYYGEEELILLKEVKAYCDKLDN